MAATDKKANHKMVSTYLFTLTLNKATKPPYSVNTRFVKELIKVFFTLLLKLQFVDIVMCLELQVAFSF